MAESRPGILAQRVNRRREPPGGSASRLTHRPGARGRHPAAHAAGSPRSFPMRHCLWLVLLLTGCGRTPAESPPAPAAPSAPDATPVTLGPPVRQALKRSVEQPGHVEAFERTALHAKIPGFVKSIRVDIGDRVTAGQLLAELDEPEMEQDLLQKQAAVAQARAEVEQ